MQDGPLKVFPIDQNMDRVMKITLEASERDSIQQKESEDTLHPCVHQTVCEENSQQNTNVMRSEVLVLSKYNTQNFQPSSINITINQSSSLK